MLLWYVSKRTLERVHPTVRFRVKSTGLGTILDSIVKVVLFAITGFFGYLLFHLEAVGYKADSEGIPNGVIRWLAN